MVARAPTSTRRYKPARAPLSASQATGRPITLDPHYACTHTHSHSHPRTHTRTHACLPARPHARTHARCWGELCAGAVEIEFFQKEALYQWYSSTHPTPMHAHHNTVTDQSTTERSTRKQGLPRGENTPATAAADSSSRELQTAFRQRGNLTKRRPHHTIPHHTTPHRTAKQLTDRSNPGAK